MYSKIKFILLLFFLLLSYLAPLSANASTYISGHAGYFLQQNPSSESPFDLNGDDGFGGNISFGGEIRDKIRSEVELGYSFTKIDLKIVDLKLNVWSAMANLYYDFFSNNSNFKRDFRPFFGFGIGGSKIDADLEEFGEDDDLVFAYQAMVGFGIPLSSFDFMEFKYRYFATTDPSFKGSEFNYGTHSIMLGIRMGM